MSNVTGQRRAFIGAIAGATMAGVGLGGGLAWGQAAETFASVMAAAMGRMDREMMAPSSGNPDRDFAAMMIPHHQGAIDMAEAELRFGHDPELRRLAQEIVAAQKQEIGVMRAALARLPAAAGVARPGRTPGTTAPMVGHGTHR